MHDVIAHLIAASRSLVDSSRPLTDKDRKSFGELMGLLEYLYEEEVKDP